MTILKEVEISISRLLPFSERIEPERRKLLAEFSDYISVKTKKSESINLIFICTHNSRRSHISQIWAQTSAAYYEIRGVNCYSGGTEATAFNPRAVKAMREMGFRIEQGDSSVNPVYKVYYSESAEPLDCFSKKYDDPFNPQKDFAAVMTCSDADENCPYIPGALARFPIRYEDPKIFDDTDLEEIKYRERCEQIAAEMLYAFSLVKK